MSDALSVARGIAIPRSELEIKASRAGGPGGQHVNTSSTRIEISWNIRNTSVLHESERARVLHRLAPRIDGDGFIRMVASATRSQRRNRQDAESRLAAIVARALQVPKKRIATRTPPRAKEARLESKKKHGARKKLRRATRSIEE